MTSSEELSGTFEDPTMAMKFRDTLTTIVEAIVKKLRPPTQFGTVLTITRDGPEFRIGDALVPEGPHPEGVGNPRQVYYAQVRLDNGETVRARVAENIPVFRSAEFYDPNSQLGSTSPYLIHEDSYRHVTIVPRTDPSGNVFDSVEPLAAHMSGPPYVPPRVEVEGVAGRYVITRIVRGIVRFENAVLNDPYIMGGGVGYQHQVGTDPLNLEVRHASSTFVTQFQGFIGDTAWSSDMGFEVELAYSGFYHKYFLSPRRIAATEQDVWQVVPPYQEHTPVKDETQSSDEQLNILLALVTTDGKIWFYVCNRSVAGLSIDNNRFLGGTVILRSLGNSLQRLTDDFPPEPVLENNHNVFGITKADILRGSGREYSFPGVLSSFTADVLQLQRSLSGGGVVTTEVVSALQYLKWTSRFLVMTSRTAYKNFGYFDIDMPAPGTIIKVVGGGVTTTATVTSSGIPFPGNNALYYVLPFGNNNQLSDSSNFVLVDYQSYFDIPEHWILIARRNTDSISPDFVLGTGREVDLWKSLSPGSLGMIQEPTYTPQYKKEHGIVYFRGAFQNNTASPIAVNTSSVSAVIPAGYRPSPGYIHVGGMLINSGGTTFGRLDAFESGVIVLRTAVPAGGEVWLSDYAFPAGA